MDIVQDETSRLHGLRIFTNEIYVTYFRNLFTAFDTSRQGRVTLDYNQFIYCGTALITGYQLSLLLSACFMVGTCFPLGSTNLLIAKAGNYAAQDLIILACNIIVASCFLQSDFLQLPTCAFEIHPC